MKKFLTPVLFLSCAATSVMAEQVEWQLEIDTQQDGQVAGATAATYPVNGSLIKNQFTLMFTGHDIQIAGNIEARNIAEIGSGVKPRISFEVASDVHKVKYLGVETASGVYEGIFFGSWGTGGDFRLDTNPPQPLAVSCNAILQQNPSAVSGQYTIQPDVNQPAFDVECDMTTDGGGWTRIGHFNTVLDIGDFTETPTEVSDPTAIGWHMAYSRVAGTEVRQSTIKGNLPLANQTLAHNISSAPTQVIIGGGNVMYNTVYINTEFRGHCDGQPASEPTTLGKFNSDYVRLIFKNADQPNAYNTFCYDVFHHGDAWGRKDAVAPPNSYVNSGQFNDWQDGVWIR